MSHVLTLRKTVFSYLVHESTSDQIISQISSLVTCKPNSINSLFCLQHSSLDEFQPIRAGVISLTVINKNIVPGRISHTRCLFILSSNLRSNSNCERKSAVTSHKRSLHSFGSVMSVLLVIYCDGLRIYEQQIQ